MFDFIEYRVILYMDLLVCNDAVIYYANRNIIIHDPKGGTRIMKALGVMKEKLE